MRASIWMSAFAALLLWGCGESTVDVTEQPAPAQAEPEEDTSAALGQMLEVNGFPSSSPVYRGGHLFIEETFKGNGRTCATCHRLTTGTISPEQVKRRYQEDKKDPLFRPLDSDNGNGGSYSKLLNFATFNVNIPLPANIAIKGSNARSVKLRRGVPTVLDMPALDPFIMLDGRQPDLASQALGAIKDHMQPGRQPTAGELSDIVAFEKELFTSLAMRRFAKGTGPEPGLPQGTTASEKRGREFFNGPTTLCGSCHLGAMLAGNLASGFPPERFSTVGVSEFNRLNNPVLTYVVTNEDGTKTEVESPDPGGMLTFGVAEAANVFKMTSLRNLKYTAPYFHDNSAPTLEALVNHYDDFMNAFGVGDLTPQDKADLVAFMKLL